MQRPFALLIPFALFGCVAEDAPAVRPDAGLFEDAAIGSIDAEPDTGRADTGPLDAGPMAMACTPPPPAPTCAELHPTVLPVEEHCAPDDTAVIVSDPVMPLAGPFEGIRAVLEHNRVPGIDPNLVRWRLEGSVPPGVWIDACTGTVQGELAWRPEGALTVVAEYDAADGCRAVRRAVDTTVEACNIVVEPAAYALPAARIDERYAAQLRMWDSDGGPGRSPDARGRYRVAADSALPPGLALDCDTGTIRGTPHARGEYNVAITWVEFECSGVSVTDTVQVEVVDPHRVDPAFCESCGPDELCVVWSDGTCESWGPECVPDPANCAQDGCSDACLRAVCNPEEEEIFFQCDPLVRCVAGPFFNCYGP